MLLDQSGDSDSEVQTQIMTKRVLINSAKKYEKKGKKEKAIKIMKKLKNLLLNLTIKNQIMQIP